MRRPRPTPAKAPSALTPLQLQALAEQASYVGSPYHKDSPNFTGSFRPRPGAITADTAVDAEEEPDCTICPRHWAHRQARATELLRQAICAGHISSDAGPDRLPKRVWARDPTRAELIYEARLLGPHSGGYKAFPLTRMQSLKLPVSIP